MKVKERGKLKRFFSLFDIKKKSGIAILKKGKRWKVHQEQNKYRQYYQWNKKVKCLFFDKYKNKPTRQFKDLTANNKHKEH